MKKAIKNTTALQTAINAAIAQSRDHGKRSIVVLYSPDESGQPFHVCTNPQWLHHFPWCDPIFQTDLHWRHNKPEFEGIV